MRAFGHERQEDWFAGLESAFQAFGGVPREVLLDNARALVLHHDPVSREVILHPRLHAFSRHWGFRVRACAPYRARTKGKDERGVGYVKRNAVAGHRFASFAAMEAHLDAWMRDVADQRAHGTTGEAPGARFAQDEARALQPLAGVPPFSAARDLVRRVGADCAVSVDGNAYSVPWRLTIASVTGSTCMMLRDAGTKGRRRREMALSVSESPEMGDNPPDASLAIQSVDEPVFNAR
ncbi:hypothetical protein ABIC30_006454 [Methylobacterium sp. 1030]